MNRLRDQVEKFYREHWDNHDKSAIPTVLHEDFTFRGSLGHEKQGYSGFAQYVDMVHEALSDYKCRIDDLVVEEPKAFARMTFSGIHANEYMGFRPTGRTLSWAGCALFTFDGKIISDVWVLGDIESLEELLRQNET